MSEEIPEAQPVPRDYMDAIREAVTQDYPDTIAVVVLKGSKESGLLGMYTSSAFGEQETLGLLMTASLAPLEDLLEHHVETGE